MIIIKRSGNTYTVLTAYHVVQSGKKYEIITPDQQSYTTNTVKQLQGLDLAIVEFSSSKTYNVAKIGNSDQATASTTVYVAGFPGRTIKEQLLLTPKQFALILNTLLLTTTEL